MKTITLNSVFHVDELAKLKLTLGNMRNYITWCRENAVAFKLHLIANGEAVLGFSSHNPLHGQAIAALQGDGAQFFVCRNAMGNFNVAETDLLCDVAIVPTGVVALAQRQQAGFAYIMP